VLPFTPSGSGRVLFSRPGRTLLAGLADFSLWVDQGWREQHERCAELPPPNRWRSWDPLRSSAGRSPRDRVACSSCRPVLMGCWRRPRDRSVVPHSDRGMQLTSFECQRFLTNHDITPSMSAVGPCADDAAAEGVFGMLKPERVNRTTCGPGAGHVPASSTTLSASITCVSGDGSMRSAPPKLPLLTCPPKRVRQDGVGPEWVRASPRTVRSWRGTV